MSLVAGTGTASSPSTSLSFFSSSFFSIKISERTKISLSNLKPPSPPKTLTLTLTCQVSTLPILSFTGEVVGQTYLDLKSAPLDTARAVVHRGIITDLQNKRRGTASTLTRGEVRGGGRKPYPQKKTGRARRGSIRSPLRPGGGVIFGPKPKDWSIKINKKEKRLAISTAISSAAEGESVVCVEEFKERFEGRPPRTKEFVEAMRRWGLDPKEKVMFLVMEVNEKVELSSRNIGTLKMLTPRTLNLFDVLNSDKMVVTPEAVEYLNGRYGVDYVAEDDDVDDDDDGGDEDIESAEAGAAE